MVDTLDFDQLSGDAGNFSDGVNDAANMLNRLRQSFSDSEHAARSWKNQVGSINLVAMAHGFKLMGEGVANFGDRIKSDVTTIAHYRQSVGYLTKSWGMSKKSIEELRGTLVLTRSDMQSFIPTVKEAAKIGLPIKNVKMFGLALRETFGGDTREMLSSFIEVAAEVPGIAENMADAMQGMKIDMKSFDQQLRALAESGQLEKAMPVLLSMTGESTDQKAKDMLNAQQRIEVAIQDIRDSLLQMLPAQFTAVATGIAGVISGVAFLGSGIEMLGAIDKQLVEVSHRYASARHSDLMEIKIALLQSQGKSFEASGVSTSSKVSTAGAAADKASSKFGGAVGKLIKGFGLIAAGQVISGVGNKVSGVRGSKEYDEAGTTARGVGGGMRVAGAAISGAATGSMIAGVPGAVIGGLVSGVTSIVGELGGLSAIWGWMTGAIKDELSARKDLTEEQKKSLRIGKAVNGMTLKQMKEQAREMKFAAELARSFKEGADIIDKAANTSAANLAKANQEYATNRMDSALDIGLSGDEYRNEVQKLIKSIHEETDARMRSLNVANDVVNKKTTKDIISTEKEAARLLRGSIANRLTNGDVSKVDPNDIHNMATDEEADRYRRYLSESLTKVTGNAFAILAKNEREKQKVKADEAAKVKSLGDKVATESPEYARAQLTTAFRESQLELAKKGGSASDIGKSIADVLKASAEEFAAAGAAIQEKINIRKGKSDKTYNENVAAVQAIKATTPEDKAAKTKKLADLAARKARVDLVYMAQAEKELAEARLKEKNAITQTRDVMFEYNRSLTEASEQILEEQKGFAEYMGADFDTLLKFQEQEVGYAKLKRELAKQEYEEMQQRLAMGMATEVEVEQKRLAFTREDFNVRKKMIGVQRDAMDKLLGKVFGAMGGTSFFSMPKYTATENPNIRRSGFVTNASGMLVKGSPQERGALQGRMGTGGQGVSTNMSRRMGNANFAAGVAGGAAHGIAGAPVPQGNRMAVPDLPVQGGGGHGGMGSILSEKMRQASDVKVAVTLDNAMLKATVTEMVDGVLKKKQVVTNQRGAVN